MSHHRATAVWAFIFVLTGGTVAAAAQAVPPPPAPARAIVELALPGGRYTPEGRLPAPAVSAQRRAIAAAADRVAARLPRGPRGVLRRFTTIPFVLVEADSATRTALAASADVVRVMDDAIVRPSLAESVALIQGDQAWDAGYDGTGTVVAILDSGVDSSHPFLAGKVIDEACFSSTVAGTSQSTCPNGTEQQFGSGAAAPCSLDSCVHGTHVAGIATGSGGSGGQTFSGVAKGARIVAVQVFSIVTDAASCGSAAPCAGAFTSDIMAGLEHVYAVAGALNVVSANMSLGGATFTAPCDDEPEKPAIDNLRSIGVATVVAAGNDYSGTALSTPACISSAVSVGSTEKSNSVSYFSNVAPFMSLFAPGGSINSSVPGGGYEVLSGTSMAAPHVAGAWAIMRQAVPGASVSTILDAFRSTGLPISDDRLFFGGGAVVPRVNILQALASIASVTNPIPTLTSISPSRVRAGMGARTISLAGSGFNVFSIASWNGTPLTTTVTSTTSLQATVPAAAISGASALVAVTNPPPGGGSSASLAVPVDPPALLSVNATSAPPSTPVTMTLTGGFGGAGDWLALAQAGSADKSYVMYTYVGSGVTTRTWTVTMPSTAGQYEFRYFPDNGYTRAATSPTVTLDASLNAVPAITSLSPPSAPAGGAAFTLAVTGTGFMSASVVQWNGAARPTTFVSSTQLQAAIGAADIATTGSATIRVLSPTPGGGLSNTSAFTIAGPPTLSVSAASVAPGASVTATLANGFGGGLDWLSFALTSAPYTSYVTAVYVGSGVTNRTWTLSAPSTPGTYEFRYFPANGYTPAAISSTVTVTGSPSAVPVVSSISPTTAIAGGAGFTLTVNGSSFTNASVVRWNGSDRATTFVSPAQLRAAIAAADIAVVGAAQVAVFTPAPGGGTSGALGFVIGAPPVLTTSATSVPAGTSVTVTLANGPGGSGDWLAFAPTGAPNTSYAAYTYVGSGVTTRTWTVTTPPTAGTYEFRLFLNNGYTRAATSPAVSVTAVAAPVPVASSLSPSGVVAGAGGFSLTVNGSGFTTTSVVNWNGSARATTVVSSSQLRAAIADADVATVGTAQVSVFTPAPGGGTSGSLTFTRVSPPTLSVSTTTAAPGASVTVTLSGGLGGASDWMTFALSSAPNTSYAAYTYVGSGVTTRTWTVTVPQQTGTYEFRLFLNNGYTRAATSPAVNVIAVPASAPVAGSLSPSKAVAGAGGFSLTVNGSAFTTTSVVNWNGSPRATTLVSSTQLRAAIADADVATVGTAQVSVFTPAPGGGTSGSLTLTMVPPPTLSVSTTTAAPGTSVTVTLSGGLGGALDWIAFAVTSAPNTSYLAYTYVGSGATTRTWTVTMPQQTGTHEFRLFLNNGYTRTATSPTVTVQ